MTLKNDRMILREFLLDDWIAVHQYASQEIVSRFQAWGPNTQEETLDYIREVLDDKNINPRERYCFAIEIDQKLVGSIELEIKSFVNREAELGYIIHPDYWGLNIATEASKLVLDFAFSILNLHRIHATCAPNNTASARVLEKLGMTREGLLRKHMLIKSGWRDSFLYSILDDEWQEKNVNI